MSGCLCACPEVTPTLWTSKKFDGARDYIYLMDVATQMLNSTIPDQTQTKRNSSLKINNKRRTTLTTTTLPKRFQPFDNLPTELLSLIFHHTVHTFGSYPQSLLRICFKWTNVLKSTPSVWTWIRLPRHLLHLTFFDLGPILLDIIELHTRLSGRLGLVLDLRMWSTSTNTAGIGSGSGSGSGSGGPTSTSTLSTTVNTSTSYNSNNSNKTTSSTTWTAKSLPYSRHVLRFLYGTPKFIDLVFGHPSIRERCEVIYIGRFISVDMIRSRKYEMKNVWFLSVDDSLGGGGGTGSRSDDWDKTVKWVKVWLPGLKVLKLSRWVDVDEVGEELVEGVGGGEGDHEEGGLPHNGGAGAGAVEAEGVTGTHVQGPTVDDDHGNDDGRGTRLNPNSIKVHLDMGDSPLINVHSTLIKSTSNLERLTFGLYVVPDERIDSPRLLFFEHSTLRELVITVASCVEYVEGRGRIVKVPVDRCDFPRLEVLRVDFGIILPGKIHVPSLREFHVVFVGNPNSHNNDHNHHDKFDCSGGIMSLDWWREFIGGTPLLERLHYGGGNPNQNQHNHNHDVDVDGDNSHFIGINLISWLEMDDRLCPWLWQIDFGGNNGEELYARFRRRCLRLRLDRQ